MYGNHVWENENRLDDEIAQIYIYFPVTGWVFSDPRLTKRGRLYDLNCLRHTALMALYRCLRL